MIIVEFLLLMVVFYVLLTKWRHIVRFIRKNDKPIKIAGGLSLLSMILGAIFNIR